MSKRHRIQRLGRIGARELGMFKQQSYKKLATMGIVYFGIWVVPLALIGAWFWCGVFSFCTGFMAGWRWTRRIKGYVYTKKSGEMLGAMRRGS